MTEQLKYQQVVLLGRVCEIQAVADKKRPSRKSKAQLAVMEAELLISGIAEADALAEVRPLEPGRPVRDGNEFIRMKLLEHLDTIAVGMFTDADKMKPTTLKLLWDLGKMNEKVEPKSRGGEMTLSKLLLSELKQMSNQAVEIQTQA